MELKFNSNSVDLFEKNYNKLFQYNMKFALKIKAHCFIYFRFFLLLVIRYSWMLMSFKMYCQWKKKTILQFV